jgi:hypothetical protein
MAINLESSPKFREDFIKLKERISKIPEGDIKVQLEGYLRTLVSEVRNLDVMHGELTMRKDLPNGVSDSRTKIVEMRKKIDRILESWERANS